MIGDEYKDKNLTVRIYCEEKTIKFYFKTSDHRFSSSGLRREVVVKELPE